VNKQLNCDSDVKIISLIFKSPDLSPLDYHVRCNTGTLYAKTNQHCRAEDCVATVWNHLPQEFTDKETLWFRKRLGFCVAAAGRYFEHSV